MSWLWNLITFVTILVALFLILGFVRRYRAATGTTWQRIVAAERDSATMALQKLGLVVGIMTNAINQVLDFSATLISDQAFVEQAKQVVQSKVTVANVGIALAIFSALGIWARLRTLGKKTS